MNVRSVPLLPHRTVIGHRPAWVELPTFQRQVTVVPVFAPSPLALETTVSYSTLIVHRARGETLTVRRASSPGETVAVKAPRRTDALADATSTSVSTKTTPTTETPLMRQASAARPIIVKPAARRGCRSLGRPHGLEGCSAGASLRERVKPDADRLRASEPANARPARLARTPDAREKPTTMDEAALVAVSADAGGAIAIW
jgi:hypothetical protein